VPDGSEIGAPPSSDSVRETVQAIVTGAGSSFYWAFCFLPRPRREGMFAVYAFCRTVDDIADGDSSVEEKLNALDEWRAEVRRMFAGQPTQMIARALLTPIERFDLHQEDFLAVIDGMVMDASGRMCAPGLLELELYCRRVAGAVGKLSASIFGVRRPEGRSLALSLGQALQYTNILRDLAEDADDGRLYIPRELLDSHGIASRDPHVVLRHPAIMQVAAEMVTMAEMRFRAARRVLKAVPRGPARPARIMLATYQRLLSRLVARGFEPAVWAQPVVRISAAERLAIAVRECFR
jgi:squalene synthase HpnD